MHAKNLPIKTVKRIVSLYEENRIPFFPRLLSYRAEPRKSFIEFEYIEGELISEADLESAFFSLGKLHSKFKITEGALFFRTLCHGDVHIKNMVNSPRGIFFIDNVNMHIGWNYTDLDYVDMFGLFDMKKFPWIIKNDGILEAYFKGAGIKPREQETIKFRRKAAVYALKKYIRNGIKNNIDVSFEISCLNDINKFSG
ncbi:MAG: hypothetical protein JNK43_04775 [Ignavibacteria bacterium]|nr:hypothetical protein [Ignavibacteria bacterium]